MKLYIDKFTDRRFGVVVVGVTDSGLRFVGIGKNSTYEAAFAYAKTNRLTPARVPSRTGRYVKQLKSYFAGKRKRFSVKFDLGHLPEFTRKTLRAALKIPYGKTSTYGDLARIAGKPQAARAVGRIMAANPVPIIIPCHRVVGVNGDLTGYGGGIVMKKKLLSFEKA